MPKKKKFLVYQEFSCTIFFRHSFGYFFTSFLVFYVDVNEKLCKNSQISRSFDQFSRKNYHFQAVPNALEMTYQIPRSLKACMSPTFTTGFLIKMLYLD